MSEINVNELTKKDFVSDQAVRWCPGCGDYAILAQAQKQMPTFGRKKEDFVFVSGIGCSSRFPYYMNTYGFHSIHGRAPAVATGVKIANPDLSVWVITGDGDGLSIGGNHFLHCLRRNVDLKVLLFNNRIYGLTKGQYSPTSLEGHRTKSSPMGSIDSPLHPLSVAIGAEATFVARTQDTNTKHLSHILQRAADHKGTAFVEIYQNCVVFNPTAWDHTTDRDIKEDNILYLEDGKPLIYGKDRDKGLRMNGLQPEIVNLSQVDESELIVHSESEDNPHYAYMLSRMEDPDMPLPFGVLRSISRPTYDELLLGQVEQAVGQKGEGDLDNLFKSGDTWTIE